ncbi:hypothetical protein L207DRAFT_160723 [Hyaloscypha variabilis F]|uniref:Uncharacterized protein n=1 Tax=Hyaloscypha variabilis (strain UAMH 11265 / GT02V1 / F) TaxID=1149755 RepID=A0A2J6SA02_HYAVF|nr:hypothetical protein L207DRAFT_160723 [Hyaloscypha variabilis F]
MAFRPGNARLYRATNEITKGSAANKSMKLLHSLNCMGIIAHPHEPPSIHFPSFLHDKSSSPIISTTVSSQPHHHTKPAVIKYAKSREKGQRDPNIPTPATMKSPKANCAKTNEIKRRTAKTTIKSHLGIWVLRARVYPASVTSP